MSESNIPSNPSDRKKIASSIDEIVNAEQHISDKRSFIKDVKNNICKEYGIDRTELKQWIAMRKSRTDRSEIENSTQSCLDGYEQIFTNNNINSITSVLDTEED